jgi:hypothetical protein
MARRLEAAGFAWTATFPQHGELWVKPNGKPVFVSYIGMPKGIDFSTESLEVALGT